MHSEHSPEVNDVDASRRLRADLGGISVDHGDRTARIVIDDIGGRFARIPNHLWKLLVGGEADTRAWYQATAAGWTRSRHGRSKRSLSLLAIRFPLFNVDFVARHLSAGSDWIFAPAAVKFWITMMVAAGLFSMSQCREILGTIGEMPAFFSSSGAWLLGSVFVGTKLLHELGHAIACRRSGVRCGNIGLIFFCGIPCPYCDVTQVWRHPKPSARAAVMLAGMYVEGILATIATLIWALADDGPARLHAMNVMIVCSVSTLVFNANPLMRYDGYYVLSDWVNSVNLRSESRAAFGSLLKRLSLPKLGLPKLGSRKYSAPASTLTGRTAGMVIYYLASTVYRYLVLATIAAAVFVFADSVGLKLIAAIGLLVLAAALTAKTIRRSSENGKRSSARKLVIAGLSLVVLGIVLVTPVPRRTTAHGFVDAADATEVFLGANGIVESIDFEIGQQVIAGQELARVRDDRLAIEAVGVLGQLKVATYRTRTARRQTLSDSHSTGSHLSGSQSSGQLESLKAVESALKANLVSLDQNRSRLSTRAPVSGTVLPTLPSGHLDHSGGNAPWTRHANLIDRQGMRSDKGTTWCRIATDNRLCVVLRVDAKYRESVIEGMIVRGHEMQSPTKIHSYRVVSISSVSSKTQLSPNQLSQSSSDASMFEILCEPTKNIPSGADFLSRVGGPCKAVIELPSRSIADDLTDFLFELLT